MQNCKQANIYLLLSIKESQKKGENIHKSSQYGQLHEHVSF